MVPDVTIKLARTFICCVVIAASHLPAIAQSDAQLHIRQSMAKQYPTVHLQMSVVNAEGVAIHGLSAAEFEVTENDHPVSDLQCREVRRGEEDLAVLLAVDRSGSMQGEAFERTLEAVNDFASRLNEGDVCAIMPFSTRVDTPLDFTSDRSAIADFARTLRVGGDTALHDAIVTAGDALEARSEVRRALLLLTDGQDTASVASRNEAIEAAKSADVPVYCIGLGPDVNAEGLQTIASATGGGALAAAGPEDLVNVYRSALEAIESQYELSYHSPDIGAPLRTALVRFELGTLQAEAEHVYRVPTATAAVETGWDPLGIGLAIAAAANLLVGSAVLVSRRRQGSRGR